MKLDYLKRRFPARQSLAGAYAFLVFLLYSWTLLISFYKLPSWLFYLDIPDLLSIYAYAFAVNFAESLLALAALILLDLTAFLPFRREGFQTRAMIFALIALGSAMARLYLFRNYEFSSIQFTSNEILWWALTFLAAFALSAIGGYFEKTRRIFETIADRMIVFLYIYLPVSALSLAVILFRNL